MGRSPLDEHIVQVNNMKIEMRFTVEAPTGARRQLSIVTDSVEEFSRAIWFRQFIGLDASEVKPVIERDDQDLLRVEVDSLRRQLEAERARRSTPSAPLAPPPRPVAPQQPAPFNGDPLSLNPDQMTDSIFRSLSPQQQSEYQRKWLQG